MEISHTIPKQPGESAQSHHKIPTTSMLEISHYVSCLAVDDETKFLLMENNKPLTGFKFPAKQYKDKQKKGGVMNTQYLCIVPILKTESQTRTSQTYLSPNHIETGKMQNLI